MTMEENVTVVEADLGDAGHQRDVVAMTAAYARDAMGGNSPLPDDVLRNLIRGLKTMPTTVIFLAYAGGKPVGIATCFMGFSTFAARPLLNIHDLAVVPEYRRRGISRRLLDAVEGKARTLDCCKLTLEVVDQNDRARKVYTAAGFMPAVGGKTKGKVLFYSKSLPADKR